MPMNIRFSTQSAAWTLVIVVSSVLVGCSPSPSGPGTDDQRTGGGRIPNCLSDGGIDLFAAEGDEVLGVSWNNQGEWDASGGYQLRFGIAEDALSSEVIVDCTDMECEYNLTGLDNGVTYFLAVDSLDTNGATTQTSCAISAMPNPLAFLPDVRVHENTEGVQDFPDIVAGKEGVPLFIAWEDGGAVRLARSDNLGDTWGAPVTVGSGSGQSRPALAFRDLIEAEDEGEGEAAVELPPYLFVVYAQDSEIMLVRAAFPAGLEGAVQFESPVSLGSGANPDITIGKDLVHVAFENGGTILAVFIDPDSLTVGTPVRVDTASGEAYAPSIAAHRETGDVYVGFDARRESGDTNVYMNVSTDAGQTFLAEEVRIDDDPLGQNQLNIFVAVDERSGQILATWEDRRGGANVFFASSEDNGLTWGTNIQTGAGLGGDQFTPQAVVDPGRNVYVVFGDTTDGWRVVFSRFNPDRTFDPPLPVSTAAGKAGAVAEHPAVTIVRFGSIFVTWSENRASPNVDIYFARAE